MTIARSVLLGLLVLGIASTTGCSTRKTIYRTVPSYYSEAGVTEGEYIDEEGNRVVVRYDRPAGVERRSSTAATGADLRRTADDGNVTLYAILPEHVIQHLQQCLLDEEYELLWKQLLAKETRAAYEDEEQGLREFEDWCRRNRNDLYSMLNRMAVSLRSPEVMIQRAGNQMRVELHPTIGRDFRFTMLDMVYEGYGLKLVMAR